MEFLKVVVYASFGFLAYKISGVFIQSSIMPVIIGIALILIIFLLVEKAIPFFSSRR